MLLRTGISARRCLRLLQVTHEEGREFFMQMRRNPGFETGGLSFVMTFDDLPDLMQEGDHAGAIMRHGQFQKFANRAQLAAQLLDQRGNAFPISR